MTTWREQINREMGEYGETAADSESCDPLDFDFDREWEQGRTMASATSKFTVWTAKRVYFPQYDDGWQFCASVARNPEGEVKEKNV